MIQRNITIGAPGALYAIVFSSDPGSVFISILVKDLFTGKTVLNGTVKWRRFETLKIYGQTKAEHVRSLLEIIERELDALLKDYQKFSNELLN